MLLLLELRRESADIHVEFVVRIARLLAWLGIKLISSLTSNMTMTLI
jgi:hypothetical protein